MKRVLHTSAVAGLALALGTPATAAPFITIVTGSGTFGNDNVPCPMGAMLPCAFSDTITFTTPAGYTLTSLTLSSAQVGSDASTNIDFTTTTLNNKPFTVGETGFVEFRFLFDQVLTSGVSNSLLIAGYSGGRASYAGTLVFAANAVPEPASWVLMLSGFGVIGYGMRRRPSRSVNYA